MRSVAPKYGATKRGPKAKSKAKPAVREPTGDGPIMILVREILSGMKGLEPDITAGWCANVESAAAAMESGATVQDWLGTSSEEAQVTMKAFVAEMTCMLRSGSAGRLPNTCTAPHARVTAV